MNQKPYLLVLGAGTMQLPIFEEARSLGLMVIAADGNARAVGAELADIFIPEDLKDPDGILRSIRILGLEKEVAGVFTAGTDFSYSVALIAEALGLPGVSPETALAASNKGLMRQKFKDAGVSSPEFVAISEGEFFGEGLSGPRSILPFPWVVKPVDNMGSRGVQRVENEQEASLAVGHAISFSRTKTVILEECIPGKEYSIDSLLFEGEMIAYSIAQRHIHFPPYFVETGHSFPSGLAPDEEGKVIREFARGIRALGITTGAAKGDVFWDSSKAYIGEIAARLSGGYMSGWTLPYATGMNFTRAGIQIALGNSPDPLPRPDRGWVVKESAVVSFPGKVKSVEFAENLELIPGYRKYFSRCSPGDILSFPRNNVEKAGNVIFSDPNRVICEDSTRRALNSIFIRLDPDFAGSKEILSNPDHPAVPIAYPQALSGTVDFEECGWDGKTYGDSLRFLMSLERLDTPEKAIPSSLVFILRRYGLQAAVLAADIEKKGEGKS